MQSKYYLIILSVLALVSMVVAYERQKSNTEEETLCIDQTKMWLVSSAALIIVAGFFWLHQNNTSKEALGVMLMGFLLLFLLALPMDKQVGTIYKYDKTALWSFIPGVFLMAIPAAIVTMNLTRQHQAVLSVLYLMAWIVFGVLLAFKDGHVSKTKLAFTLSGSIMTAAGTALLWSYKVPFMNITKTDNLIMGGSSLVTLGWLLIVVGSSINK